MGWDCATGGEAEYFSGFAGGLWKNGFFDGSVVTLYCNTGGGGTFGILTDYASAGTYYPDIEMWEAGGDLSLYIPGRQPDGSALIVDGNLSPMTSWGLYNLKIESFDNTFSNPAGTQSWSAMAGGWGEFGLHSSVYDEGYWLATVGGNWSPECIIQGYLGRDPGEYPDNPDTWGIYLTPLQTGVIGGPVYGLYSDTTGSWIGESLGTWEGQALAFSGRLDNSPGSY